MNIAIFENVGNVPNLDNTYSPRIQLNVNAKGVPVQRYWRKRLSEGGIRLEVKQKTSQTVDNSKDSKSQKNSENADAKKSVTNKENEKSND